MIHLTLDEMRAWRDAAAPDLRERVVMHLAECDRCCSIYAELIRTRPSDLRAAFAPGDFAREGYRVRAVRPSWWNTSWFRPATALAACALLAVTLWQMQPEPDQAVTRGGGSDLALVSPADAATADASVIFEWRAQQTSTCRLRVLDPARPEMAIVDRPAVSGGRLVRSETERLTSGVTYRWFVECRSPGGETLSSSTNRFTWR